MFLLFYYFFSLVQAALVVVISQTVRAGVCRMAGLLSVKWSGDGLQTVRKFEGDMTSVPCEKDSDVLQFTKKSAVTKMILL